MFLVISFCLSVNVCNLMQGVKPFHGQVILCNLHLGVTIFIVTLQEFMISTSENWLMK